MLAPAVPSPRLSREFRPPAPRTWNSLQHQCNKARLLSVLAPLFQRFSLCCRPLGLQVLPKKPQIVEHSHTQRRPIHRALLIFDEQSLKGEFEVVELPIASPTRAYKVILGWAFLGRGHLISDYEGESYF